MPAAGHYYPPNGSRISPVENKTRPRARQCVKPGAWCGSAALALACFLPAAALFAQGPSQAPESAGGVRLYSVEGRLVAGPQRDALRGVTMQIVGHSGAPEATCVTDGDGAFGFYRLREGAYALTFAVGSERYSVPVQILGGSIQGVMIRVDELTPNSARAGGHSVSVWSLRIPEKARKHYDAGIEALKKNDLKGGLDEFEKAVEVYSQYADALAGMGTTLLLMGRPEKAAPVYEKALALDENLPDANLGLGLILTGRKEYEQAEKYLLRALMMKPDDWRVHLALGENYVRAGQWPQAERSLCRARELHRDSPRVYVLLINALAAQEKYPEQLALMEEYLRLFPDGPMAEKVREKRAALEQHLRTTLASKP